MLTRYPLYTKANIEDINKEIELVYKNNYKIVIEEEDHKVLVRSDNKSNEEKINDKLEVPIEEEILYHTCEL
ncbi:17601_t:CDS:2 [Gigaspora margarita]|uniref:17601_t:CDS:1 n=1 Tax=Gigaspora margarita TaxID=4874 RepID=A0ABM8VYJ7_GIGMA|nr:17601_t:CDS:2 [Gigaspora margarita]